MADGIRGFNILTQQNQCTGLGLAHSQQGIAHCLDIVLPGVAVTHIPFQPFAQEIETLSQGIVADQYQEPADFRLKNDDNKSMCNWVTNHQMMDNVMMPKMMLKATLPRSRWYN